MNERDRYFLQSLDEMRKAIIIISQNIESLEKEIYSDYEKLFNEKIDRLYLSKRVISNLKSNDICTIGHLIKFNEKELLYLNSFGEKSFIEVSVALAKSGLRLKKGKILSSLRRKFREALEKNGYER
jgi:DNA-directed RNA polymerase alpha subunit